MILPREMKNIVLFVEKILFLKMANAFKNVEKDNFNILAFALNATLIVLNASISIRILVYNAQIKMMS